MLDILIRGGLIVDGTGAAPRQADLGVAGGRIVAIGDLDGAESVEVYPAEGLAVAPGFIDLHSHSDLTLPSHPRATSSLVQGITTEVAGSCGWSLAPLKGETAQKVLKGLCQGLTGAVPPEIDPGADGDGDLAWYSFGEYLAYLEQRGIGVNLYPIVGQSLLRAHVVGGDRRRATTGELRAMEALLEACLDEGARGLSTGRSYAPGANAPTEEIVALARVVARRGGLYTSHIKDEGSGVVEAVEEAIRIGRESGVRVEVSHHKAVGRGNFGRVTETLGLMERARSEGVDVTCDVYPYAFAQVFSLLGAFSDVPGSGLDAPDPPEAEVRRVLARPEFREAAVNELLKLAARTGKVPGPFATPAHYLVVAAGQDHDLAGLPLDQALRLPEEPAAAADASPGAPDPKLVREAVDRVLDFILAQNLKVNIAAVMDEADVETVLRHPATMVGTDAFTLDRELDPRTPIHPRHYGTFPRVLGHYRRDRGLADLAEMVRKITALPARKLGISDRGLLARGLAADVVVFDPETIADRATGGDPYRLPVGLRLVLVNGRTALREGEVLGAQAGQILRR